MALVNVQTLLLSIALETGFTFAGVVGRQVAALGIFNAFSSQFRILALVDIRAGETIAFIARVTGTGETAQSVGTLSENVTRSIFALVFVWSRAAAASVAIVTMALVIQTGAILASGTFSQDAITGAFEFGAVLVGAKKTIGDAVAQL